MKFEKIKAPTVREQFVRELENKILSGEFKPGDKLPPAKELGELMGVSLTVVNAGISELANNGFIDTVPRRGTYIADYKHNGNTGTLNAIMRYNGGRLSGPEIRSLCETRIALDGLVARSVVKQASDEDISSLKDSLRAMEEAASGSLDQFCALATGFYRQLAVISGNVFLALLYNSTFECQKGIYDLFCQENGSTIVMQSARSVYEALAARDEKLAQQRLFEAVNAAIEGPTAII